MEERIIHKITNKKAGEDGVLIAILDFMENYTNEGEKKSKAK